MRGNRGEGEGQWSIILSVLDSGKIGHWLALKRGDSVGVDERSSDGNKRETRGSVSNLDGTHAACPCKDCSVDDRGGVLDGGDRRKCRLGALYLGSGVIAVGWHLLSVDGIGIVGHGSIIILTGGG